MGAFRDAIWGAKNGDSKAVELLYDQFSPLLLKCSIQWHKNQIQQAHLAACTGFPGTATGLAGGTERKPQAVR